MIGAESRGETDPKAVLNNVGALVRRDIWERYKLHGYYGEDLDLSLKLLKDGHKFALVPSIKVVHSHTRPASYFFKRFFVSTLFQSEMFSDVRGVDGRGTAEAAASVRLFFRIADRLAMKASGLKAGIAAAKLRNELGLDLFEVKNRSGYLSDRSLPWSEFADSELRSLLQSLESSRAQPEPGQVDALLGRFTATFVEACKFLESVYSALDRQTLEQAAAMMLKIASIVCGNYLAAYYVSHAARPQERESLAHMRSVLAAGI